MRWRVVMTRKMSPPVISKPDWGLVQMPWGKHKGSLLMDIPPSYLRWAVRTWEPDTPGREELLDAIKNFLNQANA
jgi:putative quorum-sensing-regulated virulence factor